MPPHPPRFTQLALKFSAKWKRFFVTSLVMAIGVACAARQSLAEAVDFNRDIRPILSENCFACHGPDSAARAADLRLDDRESALTVLSAGQPDASELLARVSSVDADSRMPPVETGKRLTVGEVARLRLWVEQGAPFATHWSWERPRQQLPPDAGLDRWSRNSIDGFVLAKLKRSALTPAAAADRATLIRRVTLDLTGLPPTPGEVQAFLADDTPNAYELLLDRLFASPRYGEHMAASWLDAARYADTDGYQNDRYRYHHVWRDWVVDALNENKPYDEFIKEQLAGDMLPNPTLRQQIASAFGRNHRINSEDGSIPAEWHVENVADRVDTFGTVFLGLTIGCARCHDHKFDPISQRDYYSLFAHFNNVPEWGIGPNNGNSPPFIEVPADWRQNDAAPAVDPVALELRPARENEAGNGLLRPQPGGVKTLMVMQELPQPRETYLLQRGQYNLPDTSHRIWPGVPETLGIPAAKTPGNRLELAEWLADPRHPLTARVAVNRYWQHFFGTGLVKTSENFGTQGEPPSHPALLDWLAIEFMNSGWDVKGIQKRILMSATYRQASGSSRGAIDDRDNRLLARGPRFRLHPFVLRDQALAVAGLLVENPGGLPSKPYMPPKIWKSISNNAYQQDHGTGLYRRSVYTYWRRTIPPPTMMAFNAAEREICVVRKDRTNTPLQALTLMNNVVFVEAARFMAERMLREGGDRPLEFGFQLATARQPAPEELQLIRQAHAGFLARYRDAPGEAERLLKTGERPRDVSLDRVEHAAMTMMASLLLNLDETITKE